MINYSKDSKIDINALDVEWISLAETEEKYIKQVAKLKKEHTDCVEEYKLAQEKKKTIRSILIKNVHEDPEKCIGKTKATGPEAEAYYRRHKKYKAARKKEIKTEMEMINAEDAWTTAKDMKDLIHFTKKSALENLVVLHGQGYFAGPKVPRNINRIMERRKEKESDKRERKKQRTKKIGKKLKRSHV